MSFIKSRLTILAAVAAVLAGASFQAVRAESTTKQVSQSNVWMIVTYKVYDYSRWKSVYDRTAAAKRKYGWKKSTVFTVDGDRNHVMVMEEFSAVDRARAFANSVELRDEMAASGVSSNPEIRYANEAL